MKHISFLCLMLAFAAWTLPSCNTDNKPKDSEKVADKANDAKTETKRSEEDANVLVNVASSDMFEIAAAEMATTMATQASVKEFAQMMRNEHPKMMEETRMLAAKKAYTLPSTMANEYMTDIEGMRKWTKGKEFDTKYMKAQVDQHQKILDDVEKRMAASADMDVKAWAQKASSAVRMHLDKAKMISDQLDKMYK